MFYKRTTQVETSSLFYATVQTLLLDKFKTTIHCLPVYLRMSQDKYICRYCYFPYLLINYLVAAMFWFHHLYHSHAPISSFTGSVCSWQQLVRRGFIVEAGYIIRGLQYSVTAVGYWYVHGVEWRTEWCGI